jgi:hypothetical protein
MQTAQAGEAEHDPSATRTHPEDEDTMMLSNARMTEVSRPANGSSALDTSSWRKDRSQQLLLPQRSFAACR